MKKGLLVAFLMMVLSVVTFAKIDDKKGLKDVSPAQTEFEDDFFGAENVTWTSAAGYKKATFTKDGVRMSAFYNFRNEYIATTQLVDIKELSPIAIKNLIKNFSGYQMGDIIKYSSDETVFFVNLKNEAKDFLVLVKADDSVTFFKTVK